MKLYTEEQMRKCYGGVLQNVGTCIKQSDLPKVDEYLNSLTPIELPSDGEIEMAAEEKFAYKGSIMGFEAGAKWMKEQILYKNK